MKKLTILLCLFLSAGFLFAQDKKELKQLEKPFQVYDAGKIFKKADQIILPGVNLRFKTASRESVVDGSWKQQDQVKFSSWAVLEGVGEKEFQEIANEFEKMLAAKFESIGLKVLPPSAYEDTKSYQKLVEKNTKDRLTSKKNWGVAQVFSAGERPFFVYPMTPLGPHAKLGKESKALVANMLLTIDFSYIGFEVDRYGSDGYKVAEGKSSIVPVIRIEGMTENELQVRTDGTYIHIMEDQNGAHQLTLKTEFSSDKEFSSNIESCQGCVPAYSKGFFADLARSGSTTGTYRVTADPALYKAAVLDALDKLSDTWVKIYAAQQK